MFFNNINKYGVINIYIRLKIILLDLTAIFNA